MKTTFRPSVFWLTMLGVAAWVGAARAAEPYQVIANGNHINIRGQATASSEVLGQVNQGDPLTVLDTVTLAKPKEGDSTNWLKITLPASVPVWVNSAFVDTNQMLVAVRRLNLRGGPGENFSVIGTLDRGAAIKEIRRKDEWLQIETPTNAFGFVTADLFTRKAVEPVVVTPPVVVVEKKEPTPTTPEPVPVVITPPVTTPPPVVLDTPPKPLPEMVQEEAAAKERNLAKIRGFKEPPKGTTSAPPVIEIESPPKRIVTREGVVRYTVHVNVPSWFELEALDTKQIINYLYTTDTNIVLNSFRDKRVVVTGEEGLDRRWKNTPVINIQEIKAAQ